MGNLRSFLCSALCISVVFAALGVSYAQDCLDNMPGATPEQSTTYCETQKTYGKCEYPYQQEHCKKTCGNCEIEFVKVQWGFNTMTEVEVGGEGTRVRYSNVETYMKLAQSDSRIVAFAMHPDESMATFLTYLEGNTSPMEDSWPVYVRDDLNDATWSVGSYVNIGDPDVRAPIPSACIDKAPIEKCEERKAQGHCDSGDFTKWAYKKCKSTCGFCGCTDSPRWKDQDGDGCNWWRDYCVDGAVDAEEWTADELEFYDFPQKHCCGCGREDGTGPCEPDPCNKLGNTGETCSAVDNDATCSCGTEPCLANERCLAGVCVQCTSTANGATDSGNDRCRWYARGRNWRECGDYDDEDFTANEMCCECGGGSIGV